MNTLYLRKQGFDVRPIAIELERRLKVPVSVSLDALELTIYTRDEAAIQLALELVGALNVEDVCKTPTALLDWS